MSKRGRMIFAVAIAILSLSVGAVAWKSGRLMPLVKSDSETEAAASASASRATQPAPAAQRRGGDPVGPMANAPLVGYGVVWEGKLTRSALPQSDEGWRWLRRQGVTNIVNLRSINTVDYKKYGFESFLWVPLDDGETPPQDRAEWFLRFVQDPDHHPVHIIDEGGSDRSNVMTALVRYAVDGWSVEEALSEARLYGRSSQGGNAPATNEGVTAGEGAWLRAWAGANAPGSARRGGGPR